jgi:hypothetical protein
MTENSMMNNDNLGDWRIAHVVTLAKDEPAAFIGGPSHKKGTGAYLTTRSIHPTDGEINFTTPHPSALAFNIAFEYSKKANKLKEQLIKDSVIAPGGYVQHISLNSTPLLYDYFELVMIAITFSFQAIEAFLNHEIVYNAKSSIIIKRGKKHISYTPQDAERYLSTEEKAAIVLPEILQISTPNNKKPWEGFKKLKTARDSTIHIKSKDLHQVTKMENNQMISSPNLLADLLNENPECYPKYAFYLVAWFVKNQEFPRWLKLLSERENLN